MNSCLAKILQYTVLVSDFVVLPIKCIVFLRETFYSVCSLYFIYKDIFKISFYLIEQPLRSVLVKTELKYLE